MWLLTLPRGLAAALLLAVSVTAVPSVNVAMKAAFPAPPYLIELLETSASENASAYFPLLDRIADGYFDDARTDHARYQSFLNLLQHDGHVSSKHALSTFKLALSLRTAAPRIEAHFQYYETAVTPSLTHARHDCHAWALVDGRQYCESTLANPDGQVSSHSSRPLPFDRTLGVGHEVVLYADITNPSFRPFHKALVQRARDGEISYRLRYRASGRGELAPLPVSGYGVELQLKRTDYIVIDDRDAQQVDTTKAGDAVFDDDGDISDLKPLSSRELASLGLNAASFVMESENPLETLLKLTQDFPKFSASVAARNASQDFQKEHRANRGIAAPAGMNVLWMNGVQLTERQLDPHTLVDSIRRERAFIKGVTDLGLNAKEAISLLGDQEVAIVKAKDDTPRFDWTDRLEDGRVIIWLNNIEKDKRYADFPTSLSSLLEMAYPGQIPPVRKDIFNLMVPVDFSNPEDIGLVIGHLQEFVKRLLPIRFGLVPLTASKEAEAQTKVVYYLVENYGLASVMAYLKGLNVGHEAVQVNQASFEKTIKDRKLRGEDSLQLSLNEILASEAYEHQLQLSKHWVNRLEAHTEIPPVFVNGYALPREPTWLQSMSMQLTADLQQIQQGIFTGSIDDETWLPGLFLENAASKRNSYIYPDIDRPLRVLNVHKVYSEHEDLFSQVPLIKASDSSDRESWAVLTVIADFTTLSGCELALAAMTFQRAHSGVQLDLVHNAVPSEQNCQINAALVHNLDILVDVKDSESLQRLVTDVFEDLDSGYDAAISRFLAMSGLTPGAHALLLNGRVIGPIDNQVVFQEDDFAQLLKLEQSMRILPVYRAAEKLSLTDKISSPIAAAKLTSITALSTISDLPEGIFESTPTLRTALYEMWNSSHTAIEVGDPENSSIHLVALLNPTSELGQRWAPILKVLSELDGIFLRIFLNPQERLSELPIKRFYRHVLHSEPTFDDDGALLSLGATFNGLPSEALLNLGMDMPPAWLVAAKDSVHDLDNLKLSSLKSDVEATYELEHILIEGHSRDSTGKPPRGVQLLLGTEREPHFADTIIMANIGYFQFKASPGYYNLHLQEGKSSDVFDIISVGAKGYNAVPGDEGTEVALMDFQGTTLYPRLQRKEGMELADVLDDSSAENGNDLLSRGLKFAEGFLGGSKSKTKSLSDEMHAEINIFSVASGHLYERMLNIMIASVMKNTKHTVKFWFIEQFLSPSFKEFIPYLAEEYGFKYEMVTYKWPHWLRSQKEKQREIWGYKILFLDVLFPLSLDKVIFVDADQIVRTDMIDLINHDLEGAPYGFTPMCDSRTEMEGFRFWKQGYWEKYLRGLPYHISALYVVDLRRFRQLAAGDRLRQQYHQLSADPESLSNLDQDLPNHMQFMIPIHSLPQDWLWCETWCSDESQKRARTIDLCNNPLTKEPKLDRARRQVPEWTVYDDEIAALDKRRKDAATDSSLPGDALEGESNVNTKSRHFEETVSHTKDEL
ncbi:glycosyltransferase family 24 protein [Xylariaceae sp. FL0255]|nr:glycosyltransferase family 24 protein [Xylariaceae sp. FL0255]